MLASLLTASERTFDVAHLDTAAVFDSKEVICNDVELGLIEHSTVDGVLTGEVDLLASLFTVDNKTFDPPALDAVVVVDPEEAFCEDVGLGLIAGFSVD